MKRSLEKARSVSRRIANAVMDVRSVIPCDAAAIDMGNSYGAPPTEWRSETRRCSACGTNFLVTAGEQQHWFEKLRIPYYVSITYCLTCRKRQRIQHRIITRMAEVMPQVQRSDADPKIVREALLVIAEGTLRRRAGRGGGEEVIFPGEGILLTGSALIKRLRQGRYPQDDLLPILHHFQQRLGNQVRAQRLAAEIARAKQEEPALAKELAAVETWLANPGKRQRERILDPIQL